MNIAYPFEGHLYINLTNRCTNKCKFCIRFTPSGVDGIDLWLEREPTVEEIKAALIKAEFKTYNEIVFCGYGEPMLRYDAIVEVAKFIRENTAAKIRINTNGHANRAAGKDITPELEGIVDVISISLNAKNAKEYNEICVCDYGEEGFYEMLDFAKKAKRYVPKVVLSVVDTISKEDIEACRKIAEEVGVEYRVRVYSE
ncbi:MAG: TatD family nuclease-associated radical SAM protein [Eubacteriales bacterium]|nr:TatD family nuclease-associated radical SAM protein [Eubacteriales bacterium]